MAIDFSETSFDDAAVEKISVKIPKSMYRALQDLAKVLKKDQSKTVRWCLEQVLLEAIRQEKIKPPKI